MFETLARIDIRFRWPIVILWVVAAVAASRVLPSLGSVTQANNAGFLSANAPSQQAAALAAPFRGPSAGDTALIVAVRSTGPLSAADDAAIGRIEEAASNVSGIQLVRDEGTSADGQARRALVVTASSGGLANAANPVLVTAIRATFGAAQLPPGLDVHLTGPIAQATDGAAAATQTGSNIRLFTVLFVIVLLFLVYRSVLGPLVTLLPAILSLVLAEPLIAAAAQQGLPVSPATATLLPVLLLGAGADYGLFLVFRLREEVRGGAPYRDALVTAMRRVGQSITFSAGTVIVALACLILASFGLYRGLGPSLAVGVAVILAAALTLLPALLAILGRAVFWPVQPVAGQATTGVWGRLATRVVRRPVPVLVAGLVLFGALAAGLAGFATTGFTRGTTASSATDSAAGSAVLAAHFPGATTDAESLIVQFNSPVWDQPQSLARIEQDLTASGAWRAVTGALDPNGTPLTPAQLASLHAQFGPAQALPPAPGGAAVSPALYQAYRATAQFISPDGRTIQFAAVPSAGPAGSLAAIEAMPALRASLAAAATDAAASTSGVVGADAVAADVKEASTSDLIALVPIVLAAIAVLLAVLLRSLVAPLYLIATVGLSYLAALGFATTLFVRIGGEHGLNFIIPILLFIFVMALGEDYNILLMSRVREEAHRASLPDALALAVGHTGGSITSAGLILAGTFAVLGIAGNSQQATQLGFTIAFAILLDTFFVRTLLVPAFAALLGRWNWWPSALARSSAGGRTGPPRSAGDAPAEGSGEGAVS